MVKGTSRQVIVVQGPEEKLFEQAIFILKDEAVSKGITDEELMKEANAAIRGGEMPARGKRLLRRMNRSWKHPILRRCDVKNESNREYGSLPHVWRPHP